jgi:hypothetical protein
MDKWLPRQDWASDEDGWSRTNAVSAPLRRIGHKAGADRPLPAHVGAGFWCERIAHHGSTRAMTYALPTSPR